MEQRLRARPEQFTALVKFMERQGDLSKLQMGAQGRLRSDRLWLKLGRILNSIEGGVEKTVDKWKRVWADWKTKTKKKYLLQQRRSSIIGSGSKIRLTALEHRVIAILGVNAVPNHDGNLQKLLNQQPETMIDDPLAQDEGNDVHIIVESPDNDDTSSQPPTPPQQTMETTPSHRRSPQPPRPHTPPEHTERPQSNSIRSTSVSPRRSRLRVRRNLGQPLFHLTAQEFKALEQRRMQLEETREKHEHEREMARLRLESQRIEVSREHNLLLQQLTSIANKLIDTLNQHERPELASPDTIPKSSI